VRKTLLVVVGVVVGVCGHLAVRYRAHEFNPPLPPPATPRPVLTVSVFVDPYRSQSHIHYKYILPDLAEAKGQVWLVAEAQFTVPPYIPPEIQQSYWRPARVPTPLVFRGITIFDYQLAPAVWGDGRRSDYGDGPSYFLFVRIPESSRNLLRARGYEDLSERHQYKPRPTPSPTAPNPALQRTRLRLAAERQR
jgi:hypothetical protein